MRPQQGWRHSEQAKKKMSDAKKGKHRSEETKQKISRALKGKYCGEKHHFWGQHHSDETKRRVSLHRKGKCCGSDNPNFRKNFSAETRRKMSLAHKGKPLSAKHRQKILEAAQKNEKAKNHLRKLNIAKRGKPLSLAIKIKISTAHKGNKNPMFGKHLSESTKEKLSIAFSGEKHPNWQGGISFEPYNKEFNAALKRQIRQRDHFGCAICWRKENGRAFSVHHIDYNKNNNDPLNLITLCPNCHTLTGHKRKEWKRFFLLNNMILRPKRAVESLENVGKK